MIEFVLDILLTGGVEILGDALGRRVPKSQRPPQDEVRHSRRSLYVKIALGIVAGLAWGFYVGQAREGWPGAFWTFSAVGVIAAILSAARVSNEQWASQIERPKLRTLMTFTPARWASMATFSGVTAAAIAAGWFLAG